MQHLEGMQMMAKEYAKAFHPEVYATFYPGNDTTTSTHILVLHLWM